MPEKCADCKEDLKRGEPRIMYTDGKGTLVSFHGPPHPCFFDWCHEQGLD